MSNPLIDLEKFGLSIWLDSISRQLLDSGELATLIKDDHVKGVTSNPSIFEKAIAKTNDYDAAIIALGTNKNLSAKDVYERVAIKDIQEACDLLRPLYDEKKGRDGFASLEVSPHLAYDAQASIEEGKRLWHAVNRPNLMVKIPGTKEGMLAIRALIADGINVNVTLLFSVESYENAAMAFLHGLKDRAEKGLPIAHVQSVASFFISRIDAKIDAQLEKINAADLMGKIAIANAKLAYARYEEIYQSELAKNLAAQGAQAQRLLWASTSTKNPSYRDVLYVETLIGANTVNTLPMETLRAFRDHGIASNTLSRDMDHAKAHMQKLKTVGIDFSSICNDLESEGVKLFITAFDQLLNAVENKLTAKSAH